jgi:Tfp pilus assembly protein PilF
MNRKCFQTLIALFASCAALMAEPFRPATDAEILERLPNDFVRPRKTPAAGKTLEQATHEAEHYIRIYQSQLDPRYLGYAQASLRPWWDTDQAPGATILARASIKQSLHHFDSALKDIDIVLGRDPRNAHGWLLRTTLLQVRGRYTEASQSAARLAMVAPRHIAMTSIANLAGLTGRGREGLALLREILADPQLPSEHHLWALTVAAEIAERIDDPVAAEAFFKDALALDRSHTYTLATFADFLIDQRRPKEAFELVRERRETDGLLLRRALALKQIDPTSREFAADRTELKERFASARRRGDSAHAREEARALLTLENDIQSALRLAIENWESQREPADFRILLQVAVAAKDSATIQKARAWLNETHLQDGIVSKLLAL